MDNQRVLLAVSLSLAVLIFWNIFFPPPQPVAPVPASKTEMSLQEQTVSKPTQVEKLQTQNLNDFRPGREIKVETPLYSAVFAENGGILQSFSLKKHKQSVKEDSLNINLIPAAARNKAPFGLIWNTSQTWQNAVWTSSSPDVQIKDGEEATLDFIAAVNGLQIHRQIIFNGSTYGIKEKTYLTNTLQISLSGLFSYSLATAELAKNNNEYNKMQIAYMGESGREEEEDIKDLALGFPEKPETAKWIGAGNNYFLVAIIPQAEMIARTKFEDDAYRITAGTNITLNPGQKATLQLDYYLGPKIKQELKKMPNDLVTAIRYGWTDIIAKPLIQFLHFLNSYTQNYGLAIILLTIAIKIIFWPLSQKSYKSMEQMKKIQPMMTQIREKYKDNRERMNAEMMHLYKTYKINPAGGCLPMLLQIPVFIALYQALLASVELRHACFIAHIPFTDIAWLTDLSAKDPYYITPIIMGLTMFLQQKMSPAPGDPMQAKIMMFLPLIFTFIFLNFPSGLVVYWLVNNVLSIFQQWLLTRKIA